MFILRLPMTQGGAPSPARLFGRDKFFPGQINVSKDGFKKAAAQIFAFVKRDNRRAAIGMTEIDMATFLTDTGKPEAIEDTNGFDGLERSKPAHQFTSTSWIPTNSNGGAEECSTSKQSWIASLMRSRSVGKFLAWVWHPFKEVAVATKTPSSSLSITTKNCLLRIYHLLDKNNISPLLISQVKIIMIIMK